MLYLPCDNQVATAIMCFVEVEMLFSLPKTMPMVAVDDVQEEQNALIHLEDDEIECASSRNRPTTHQHSLY